MVNGEEYTIHRRISGYKFDDIVDFDRSNIWFKRDGEYTRNVSDHAVDEAGEADSASCSIDAFFLPERITLVNSKTIHVGYRNVNEALREKSIATLNDEVVLVKGEIFEAGFDRRGNLLKICARYPYDSEHDQISVIQTNNERLVTTWLNNTEDKHDSLDRSEYCTVTEIP